MDKHVYICSSCGTLHTGSGKGQSSCTECQGDLVDTGHTLEEWNELGDEQKYSVIWSKDPRGKTAQLFIGPKTGNPVATVIKAFAVILYIVAVAAIVQVFLAPNIITSQGVLTAACLIGGGTLFWSIGEIIRLLDVISKKK